MNNFSDNSIKKYYAEISVLSPKENSVATTSANISNEKYSWLYSPVFIYGSIGVFFGIFFLSLIIQILARSVDFKKTLLTIVVAFIVASIPISLRTALEFTSVQTKATPEIEPRNIRIEQKSLDTVSVSWETQTEKVGAVRIGEAPLNPDKSRLIISNSGKKALKHQVELTKLSANVDFEAEILSGDKWFNDQGQPIKIRLP